jgi:hypothetical protein
MGTDNDLHELQGSHSQEFGAHHVSLEYAGNFEGWRAADKGRSVAAMRLSRHNESRTQHSADLVPLYQALSKAPDSLSAYWVAEAIARVEKERAAVDLQIASAVQELLLVHPDKLGIAAGASESGMLRGLTSTRLHEHQSCMHICFSG